MTYPLGREYWLQRFSNSGIKRCTQRRIVVCVTSIPRSAIICTKSRELSLYVRYQRTQSTTISRSKCRPLNKSNALILDHYHRPFQPSQSLHQNRPAKGSLKCLEDRRSTTLSPANSSPSLRSSDHSGMPGSHFNFPTGPSQGPLHEGRAPFASASSSCLASSAPASVAEPRRIH